MICVLCGTDIRRNSYAQIDDAKLKQPGCSHRLCLLCFGGAHAERSANIKIECPADGCSHSSRYWTIFEFDGERHHSTDQKTRLPSREVDKQCHPVQFFSNRSTEYRRGHAVLSITTISGSDEKKSNTYCAELKTNEAHTNEENAASLARIGRSPHPFLQYPAADRTSQAHHTYANPNAISINQLEAEDNSILRRFVHAISIGKKFTKASNRSRIERKSKFQKEYNASYTATATIRSAKGGGAPQ